MDKKPIPLPEIEPRFQKLADKGFDLKILDQYFKLASCSANPEANAILVLANAVSALTDELRFHSHEKE